MTILSRLPRQCFLFHMDMWTSKQIKGGVPHADKATGVAVGKGKPVLWEQLLRRSRDLLLCELAINVQLLGIRHRQVELNHSAEPKGTPCMSNSHPSPAGWRLSPEERLKVGQTSIQAQGLKRGNSLPTGSPSVDYLRKRIWVSQGAEGK